METEKLTLRQVLELGKEFEVKSIALQGVAIDFGDNNMKYQEEAVKIIKEKMKISDDDLLMDPYKGLER
jgi:hypothetical protein